MLKSVCKHQAWASRTASSLSASHLPPQVQSSRTAAGSALSRGHSGIMTASMTTTSTAPAKALYTTAVTKAASRSELPKEAEANPHHVLKAGKVTGFKNPYASFGYVPGPMGMFSKVLWPLLSGKLKYPETNPPETIPVRKPEWLPSRFASPKLRATWLGHACYYVEYPSGLRVLFDPVFEDRCSPFTFMGPKRFTRRPCDTDDIPVVDAVLISHSHYDHLSHSSVLQVQKKHPKAQFFVGMGLEHWFRRSGIDNVTELDWWEDAELNVKVSEGGEEKTISARVSSLPCQHSSARTSFDKDTTLWCSWAVKSESKSVWFGGDTGYRAVPHLPPEVDDYGPDFESLPRCPQFAQIGEHRGPFDLGLIPIGAYHPREFLSSFHANPYDAAEIFVDTKCKRAMGIHWGTWALTFEDVHEPPMLLRDALKRKGIPELGVFDICDTGESREF